MTRHVIWFSCGVTSAVCAKIVTDAAPDAVIVSIDTGSEHDDNWRFANDVGDWLGRPIERIQHSEYTDTFDVYRKRQAIVFPHGAVCSFHLKKRVRQEFENLADDVQYFGFDADEAERFERFKANNPLVDARAPLIEAGLTKSDCRQILAEAGIQEPVTYAMGFKNANCLKTGCVKGQQGYWNHYRKHFPEEFERMAQLERELDVAINKTYVKGERVRLFLDELPVDAGRYDTEPAFQCGLFCELPT